VLEPVDSLNLRLSDESRERSNRSSDKTRIKHIILYLLLKKKGKELVSKYIIKFYIISLSNRLYFFNY
jgi:hypothetical protein